MYCKNRNGEFVYGNEGQDKFLQNLYGSKLGRVCLKILVKPFVTKTGGWFLNRRISCIAIKPFIKKSGICMDEYENRNFKSYNDFFTRKIRPGLRPVDFTSDHFISPCDGKLTVYPITENTEFVIKNTKYTMESFIRNKELAEEYKGGQILVFRLTVDDYHRYCFSDNGYIWNNIRISGVFHTVNPTANDYYPIYKENERNLSLFESENFGSMLIIEVGALMVGKIVNYKENIAVKRGEEKGRFEFGGSTIVICLKKNAVKIDEDILCNSEENIETKVKYGMAIGRK